MKILILHNILWSHYRNCIFSELQHQSGDEFQIKVLQLARNERSRASMENNKDEQGYDKINLDYDYVLLNDAFIEEVNQWDLFKQIIQQIRAYRPDVINLIGYYMPALLLTLLYCWLRGIKVVLSNDSTAMDNKKIGWRTFLKKRLNSMCSGFFNFGTLATEYMKSLGGKDEQMLANKCASVDNDFIEKSNLKYFPNRTQLQQEFAVSPKNFIFVGRFIEIKNLFTLLKSFHEAQLDFSSNWGLMLLGDGILKEKLQDYIADNGIKDVHFISGKPWYEVPKFLTMADVLVLPSTSEPWGLVVNEAMICKMPVIVSDKCGCAVDLVRPVENGFIFQTNEEETLKNYLLKFMKNEVDINKMGQVSRAIIEDFSPKKVAKSMLDGFRKVQFLTKK